MNRPSVWCWRNAIRKSDLPPLAKLCCYVLADYMTDAAKGCFPSIATLMKDTGLSNTSIAKHLRLAIDSGLLLRHRFRDRAGHCAGTNYYPRFPEGPAIEYEEEPARLGAGTFFDVPEAPKETGAAAVPACARRSPWAAFPSEKCLNEPSVPREPQSVPGLTPLTHNLPVEPSQRKLLLQPQDEFQESSANGRRDLARAGGEEQSGRDEAEIAFVAWTEMAKKLAIPAYASQLTIARRTLLRHTLSSAGGLGAWQAILDRLPRARFLLGQGKRGFWISFEALCSETIRVRLLEGAYDHVPGAAAPAKPSTIVHVPVARWRDRMRTWVRSGKAAPEAWPASWGPVPGSPGCIVPEECLAGLPATDFGRTAARQ
jgi:hypothetical protein